MKDREAFITALLEAYRAGAFPMGEPDGSVEFYMPRRRGVLPLDERFHVPRRLEARVRSRRFTVTSDEAFDEVIRGCAAPRRGREETWINEWIIGAYTLLHRAGHAHSVEAWLPADGQAEGGNGGTECGARTLVGGLYGVALAGAFFAESKFSDPARGGTDASKVCLVHLVRHLRRRGYVLLDVQLENPHLKQFGLEVIARRAYERRLEAALATDASWGDRLGPDRDPAQVAPLAPSDGPGRT